MKKDILIILGIGVVGYYLYNKSKKVMPLNLKSTAPMPMPMDISIPTAPMPMPMDISIPTAPISIPAEPIAIAKEISTPTAPIPMPTAAPATTTKYTYPEGIGKDGKKFELNDGDYVANGEETAILYQGKLRPMTAAYANRFAAGTWERTKILDNIVYSSIPRGAVLDA